MRFEYLLFVLLASPGLAGGAAAQQATSEEQRKNDNSKHDKTQKSQKPRNPKKPREKALPVKHPPKPFPFSNLESAKQVKGLCLLRYRISTDSPKCQQFFDQGLAWFYSYAYAEAVRSFETAVRHDPKCAMAWWGLSRAMAKHHGTRRTFKQALEKARELMPRASAREQMLVKARLQEYGLLPELKGKKRDTKYKAAIGTLNDMLSIYPEDEEAWFYRGYLEVRASYGSASALPFYKALLKINPLHPGANHELVHFYERFRRPALGWTHALAYMKSSPKIPHAWHMQAHLAMRLGRWKHTTDWSTKAVELQEAHHKYQGVKPSSDSQFSHHLEILLISLTYDGRFQEADAVREKCRKYGFRHNLPWFQLHMAKREYDKAMTLADTAFGRDETTRAYLRALVHFAKEDRKAALHETEVVRAAHEKKPKDQKLEKKYWTIDGIAKCRKGNVNEGLKQLKKLVDWSKDDYRAHSWGGGASYMLIWGKEALRAGRFDVAEEAFLEAIAHDPGNVYGCLGMQAICEVQDRKSEAKRFAEIAKRSWAKASSIHLQAERNAMRELVPMMTTKKSKAEDSQQK